MNKKTVWMLILLNLASVHPAGAQQPKKVPRIGFLSQNQAGSLVDAFRQGLRDLGYVEGKNIVVEYRWAEGKYDKISVVLAEFARLKVDVIVAGGGAVPALAAKKATTTIPVVVTNVGDPVAFGLVDNLARPGGNITGLAIVSLELSGKRLEILKETIPKVSRMAVLWSPENPGSVANMKATEAPASSLGITLQSIEVRQPDELERAFSAMKKEHAGALVVINSPLVVSQLKQIVRLAAKHRLPAIYNESRFVEDGGLMSYGPNYADLYRRAATYVDKILKGAKPADLPVEQPTKFELVINLKTAKQINLTIPPNVLARADKVIK
jgi:ABC-type uncharacterized transport system substrate-binding protein